MTAQANTSARAKRRGIGDLVKGGAPIVGLTAYTAPIARLLDPHVDFLLVGDSLGMVVYGFDSTLPVTLEMMIAHGAAVMRASARALVVVDLPFGSYQESREQAFRNAARLLAETGCAAVKLEGGQEMADTVRYLSRRGIPVMGHVGLMPQSVNAAGGFKIQGRGEDQEKNPTYGPSIAGKKAIGKAGQWFGNMLHLELLVTNVLNADTKQLELQQRRVMYTQPHADPISKIPFPAKVRAPFDRKSEIEFFVEPDIAKLYDRLEALKGGVK